MIPHDYTGPAIRSDNDADIPVIVTGWAGEAGGEQFFTDENGSFVPGKNLFVSAKAAEDARHWATLQGHLHRGGEFAYWWITPAKFSYWWPTSQPGPLPGIVANVYFGVHPSVVRKGVNQRARLEDLAAINCLFAEFDAKDFEGHKDRVQAHMNHLPAPPTIVIDSGGGYHAYWLLATPFLLDSVAAQGRARALQAAWVAFVGGDPGAKDLARVLRVPGTPNLKYHPHPTVTFAQVNFARQYKVDALEQLATSPQAAEQQSVRDGAQYWLERALQQAAQGNRNVTGFWLACQLRDNGIGDLQARGVMQAYARRVPQGSSPYAEQEAMASLREAYSGARRDPARSCRDPHASGTILVTLEGQSVGFEVYDYRPEDGGILDLWMDLYASGWRFVTGWELWIYWAGTHWEKDTTRRVQALIQRLIDGMNQAAKTKLRDVRGNKELERMVGAYVVATKRSKTRVTSVEEMAKAFCAVEPDDLDAGNLLNMQNGTIDLDTLIVRQHDPNDLLTYVLPYAYDAAATCPRWEQFIAEVLVTEDCESDPCVAGLYQELFGYSLTRHTHHEKMIWQAGDGGNGKTVAISVLEAMLGSLSKKVNFNTLGTPGNYDLAELPGKRVIFSTEAERGGKVVEGLIRHLVSGETIATRAIYGKPFEFKSVSKIWWSMNDKPTIRDTSNATWRRLVLIPFNRTFTDADKDLDLIDKLKLELPGILNWSLEGLARLNQHKRFTEPLAVFDAISEYRRESNPVAQWMNENTVLLQTPMTLSHLLYEDYKAWCETNGRQPLNSTNFGSELKRLKVEWKRIAKGVVYARGLLVRSAGGQNP